MAYGTVTYFSNITGAGSIRHDDTREAVHLPIIALECALLPSPQPGQRVRFTPRPNPAGRIVAMDVSFT